MSVQQVKNQFAVMENYLARDVKGLENLRKLKEAVNVLRTNLASAQEQAESCATTRQRAVERAVSAEIELANSRTEMHSLQQRLENATHDLKAATKVESTHEDSISDPMNRSEMTGVIKRLRRSLPHCPPALQQQKEKWLIVYDRESLAEGWSHESLWSLGASVAILCAFGGAVAIRTNNEIKDMEPVDEDRNVFGRHVIQWLAKNNIDLSTKHDTRAGFARLRNVTDGASQQAQKEIAKENLNAAESRWLYQ